MPLSETGLQLSGAQLHWCELDQILDQSRMLFCMRCLEAGFGAAGTFAAFGTDAQLILQVFDGFGAVFYCLVNLSLSDCITHANVHIASN